MKNSKTICRRKLDWMRAGLLLAGCVLIIVLAAGCAGTRRPSYHSNPLEESFTLPPFLTGAVGVLLTNTTDYSARMMVELPSYSAKSRTITGNLLGQGTRLLFAPAVGDRSFVWDSAQNSGYILSEALQGFAPIASSVRVTNFSEQAGAAGPVLESVNGRPCNRTQAAVLSSDGSTAKFHVWRTADANGLPVRIKSMDAVTPLTINFFDARRESLTQKLFLPPDGFTRYTTAQTLRDELAMRQKVVGRKTKIDEEEPISGVGHSDVPSQISR